MPEANRRRPRDEALQRSLRSTERHSAVARIRQLAVKRAKEVEMIGGRIALLMHNTPENDSEITRLLTVMDRTIASYHRGHEA